MEFGKVGILRRALAPGDELLQKAFGFLERAILIFLQFHLI